MKTLLIIAHTPSINTQKLSNAVYQGAKQQVKIDFPNDDLQIIYQTPQETVSQDVLNADAVIFGTTENIAYMAGLSKDFFDRCYNDLLNKKVGMPYAIYIRAGLDGTATKQALLTINNALKWQLIDDPLILQGTWTDDFTTEVSELAMAMVAGLAMGIF